MSKLIKLLNKHCEDIFIETNNIIFLIDSKGNIIDFNSVFEERAGSIKPGSSNINQFLTDTGFRILFHIISNLKLNKRNNSVRIALNFSFLSSPLPILYDSLIISCGEKKFLIYGEEFLPFPTNEEIDNVLRDEMIKLKKELHKNKEKLEKISSEVAKKNKQLLEIKNRTSSEYIKKHKFYNILKNETDQFKSMTDALLDTRLTAEQEELVEKARISSNKILTLISSAPGGE